MKSHCIKTVIATVACAALTCGPGLSWSQPANASADAASAADPKNGYAEILKPTRARPAARPDKGAKTATVIQNQPYMPIRKLDDEGPVAEIEMFVGESRVFPAPGVARIAVGNGSILTAAALDNNEVILFANGTGVSSLFIWNADGRYQRVKISIVPGDTTRHAREIAAFLATIPKARASVVGANIIVEGDDLSDADIAKIEELAKRYPQIVNFTNRVGWEQMVMLDVKVVEFPVSLLSEVGLKWSATGGAAVAGIWSPAQRIHNGPYEVQIRTGADNAPPVTGPDGTSAVLPRSLNALAFMNMGLNAQLNLLAQDGKATLLAEPQLSARSGSKASFLAGGEVPYSVVTRDGASVQFKTYGVKLDITPRIDHRGVVRATIQTEVSSIDRSVTTDAGPGLLSRKTDTEFNLRNGETIVLSGLLQRETSTDVDKVPLLGDLPVIGALFRSKRFQNKETELVVFVTPTLIDAQSPSMTDRVKRSQERLEQRLGENPYLSEPLQPGVSYQRPNAVASSLATVGSAAASTNAAIRPIPAKALTATARQPTADVAVPVAERFAGTRPDAPTRDGVVRGRGAAGGAAVPRAAVPPSDLKDARQYRVSLDGLPARAAPDVGADVVGKLPAGSSVFALPQPASGAWIAVWFGDGGNGKRGWVAAQWLVPASALRSDD